MSKSRLLVGLLFTVLAVPCIAGIGCGSADCKSLIPLERQLLL
ncbi:MAG: hypothetical protein WDA68_07625 [Phycisphaerae bacterium]